MKYLVKPPMDLQHPEIPDSGWTKTSAVDLGGFFYDHLLAANGAIVGVRYWTMDSVTAFDDHPVFRLFVGDKRFGFNAKAGHVDIIFDKRHAADLKNGALTVDTVQDFGGDCVVTSGASFAILFSL